MPKSSEFQVIRCLTIACVLTCCHGWTIGAQLWTTRWILLPKKLGKRQRPQSTVHCPNSQQGCAWEQIAVALKPPSMRFVEWAFPTSICGQVNWQQLPEKSSWPTRLPNRCSQMWSAAPQDRLLLLCSCTFPGFPANLFPLYIIRQNFWMSQRQRCSLLWWIVYIRSDLRVLCLKMWWESNVCFNKFSTYSPAAICILLYLWRWTRQTCRNQFPGLGSIFLAFGRMLLWVALPCWPLLLNMLGRLWRDSSQSRVHGPTLHLHCCGDFCRPLIQAFFNISSCGKIGGWRQRLLKTMLVWIEIFAKTIF